MAGRKARSNKIRAAKYASYNPKKNKERRANKQKKMEAKLSDLKAKRLELIKNCCDKLGIGIIGLKKKFGTLNIRRLNSILDGSYIAADWYEYRLKVKEEKAKIRVIKNDSNNSKQKAKHSATKGSEEKKISE